ncbi:MAG: class I SAM-dependent methyltransferase, partial [Pseudolabrys sp.]|nr:class I SAM-dependent methyltransferase [Pseudolabrys sp.]
MDEIIGYFSPGAHILEVGAGTGQQALYISQHGFKVDAIDVPNSNYSEARQFPITDYDGKRIPFPDGTFDIVFSSNVMEHVSDLSAMNAEIKRVLKPGGYCIHVMPTHRWRFWTFLSGLHTALHYLAPLWKQTVPRSSAPSEVQKTRQVWQTIGYRLAQPFER